VPLFEKNSIKNLPNPKFVVYLSQGKKGKGVNMKKIFALMLVAVFLVSVAGCTPKSEYDKLLIEKEKVEKKCNDLSSAKVRLEKMVSSREKELKSLKETLKQTKAKVSVLEKKMNKQRKGNKET